MGAITSSRQHISQHDKYADTTALLKFVQDFCFLKGSGVLIVSERNRSTMANLLTNLGHTDASKCIMSYNNEVSVALTIRSAISTISKIRFTTEKRVEKLRKNENAYDGDLHLHPKTCNKQRQPDCSLDSTVITEDGTELVEADQHPAIIECPLNTHIGKFYPGNSYLSENDIININNRIHEYCSAPDETTSADVANNPEEEDAASVRNRNDAPGVRSTLATFER